ncbi:cobalamin biosynthesis protein, partial [Desulfofundulus sp.]|uniref:cobalamin biosynthesis protein n=1 Tax=Desulfofundulus sp. TaxID=2282750 RepID=UPI003C796553
MLVVFCSYLLDLLVGDPCWFPHPVVITGKIIVLLEKLLRRVAKSSFSLRVAGVVLAVVVVGCSYLATYLVVNLAARVHPWLATGLEVLLISSTFAVRGLAKAARDVLEPLSRGDLELARKRVSFIV